MGSLERKLKRNQLKKDLEVHKIHRRAPLRIYEAAMKKAQQEQKEKMANQVYEEMLQSFKQNSGLPKTEVVMPQPQVEVQEVKTNEEEKENTEEVV